MSYFQAAAVDVSDEKGRTPLMLSCTLGQEQSALLFLELGANVHRTDHEGVTSLMRACSCKRESSGIIRALILHGSYLRDRDDKGFGLCSYIVYSSYISVLHKMGFQFGGPLNPLQDACKTYLMDLCSQSCVHLVLALLKNTNVDVNERNGEGKTALDFAVENIPSRRAEQIVEALQAAGAVHGQKYSETEWWGRQPEKRPSSYCSDNAANPTQGFTTQFKPY